MQPPTSPSASSNPTVAALLGLKPENIREDYIASYYAERGITTVDLCMSMAAAVGAVTPRGVPDLQELGIGTHCSDWLNFGLIFLSPNKEFRADTVSLTLQLLAKMKHWIPGDNAYHCAEAGIAPLARLAANHVLSITPKNRLLQKFVEKLDRYAPGNPLELKMDWYRSNLARHGRSSVFPRWRQGWDSTGRTFVIPQRGIPGW